MDPSPHEIRALGCLIEKQRTTPDQYPLSLNSLRLACNQSTNRQPVLALEEAEVQQALDALRGRRWVRLASGHTARSAKYRHLLDEVLGLGREEVALLAVLMLRGEQTPGELKQRVERLQPFESLAALEQCLGRLAERELVRRIPRRPGQKEDRFVQLLGGDDGSPVAVSPPEAPAAPSATSSSLDARVARLEEEVAELRARLA